MAYFSNGTEGDRYEAVHCSKCVHHHPERGCPVMHAHMAWNYDECDKPESILHKMIPRVNGGNGKCFSFVPLDEPTCEDLTIMDKYRAAMAEKKKGGE